MSRFVSHRSRSGVALILILGLLGMGTLDAEVCRGADGHVGIDTRFASCCGSESQMAEFVACCASVAPGAGCADDGSEARLSAAKGQGPSHADSCPRHTLSAGSPGAAACVDLPWVQGAPTVKAGGSPPAPVADAAASPLPACLESAPEGPSTPPGPPAFLARLRTTTLLI